MLIQHILTEEIFASVFNDGDFHRENNIAKELYALETLFFTGAVKKDTLRSLEAYYTAIKANAAQITSHNEKQAFLKVIYEQFYKVYNPKAADRLGVVYTPNEIVKFMIEGADYLCQKHFKKALIDKNVEILDPATGTGTYICELLEYFRGQKDKLAHKYKEELHANEVAILPYYVANLNIEATYASIMGQYAEYPNLCFVDTLDNTAGLGIRAGHQHELFGGTSAENVERIERQNKKKISVIIGNPPYNANQQNENDNNKNREYKKIDTRIKETYINQSTAQKTKLYDMYSRFYRWASDRLRDDDGIVAFITNRSFIESRTFDGFRKVVSNEFQEIHVVDLGGDVRANPKLSGTKNNVFGIQTGVAIAFLVKDTKKKGCKIHYSRRPEFDTKDDKLAYLSSHPFETIKSELIEPDKKNNWLNLTDNDWEDLMPIASKDVKAGKAGAQNRAIFRDFTLGIATNRDEWVLDFEVNSLSKKMAHFVDEFKAQKINEPLTGNIKWSETLIRRQKSGQYEKHSVEHISRHLYRPFTKLFIYYSEFYIDRPGNFQPKTTSSVRDNCYIGFNIGGRLDFSTFCSACSLNLTVLSLDANQCLPRYRYTQSGEKVDNITNWALAEFRKRYLTPSPPLAELPQIGEADDGASPSPSMGKVDIGEANGRKGLEKDDIFHYCYGVLHDPIYREKYALNLKRDFPRIPFYKDFWQWADWGKTLMDLHINYEQIEPYPIKRQDIQDQKAIDAGQSPVVKLRADKENGAIIIDSETALFEIPSEVYEYKLGNRSAIEWILDQYKEKTPKDPTIREKFNTYKFADYKEFVIDLIARVTRVSLETVAITNAMKDLKR